MISGRSGSVTSPLCSECLLTLRRETTDREIHSLATTHSEELNYLRQQQLEQLESSRQRWEAERAEFKLVTDKSIAELQSKLSSLDQSYSGESFGLILSSRDLVELSKEKLELDYVLKQQNSELEKIRPECLFYKNSMNELQELLRIKDKERDQLEQDLARSTARREALELQISDKEEVKNPSQHLPGPGTHVAFLIRRLFRSRPH